MKKLFLIFICILLFGCSEKRIMEDELVKKGQLYYFDSKLYTGIFFDVWGDGELRKEGHIKDGKLDGVVKVFSQNGQLRYEGNWKDGKMNGFSKQYHSNGQLKEEVNFKDGELISQKCFTENGQEIDCE